MVKVPMLVVEWLEVREGNCSCLEGGGETERSEHLLYITSKVYGGEGEGELSNRWE